MLLIFSTPDKDQQKLIKTVVPSRILTLGRKLHKALFGGGLGHAHQDKFGFFGIVSDALRGKIMPRTITVYI